VAYVAKADVGTALLPAIAHALNRPPGAASLEVGA
jgi:hypothetical protein